MSHSTHLPAHHERPRWQWWFVLIATPIALVLGTIGFGRYDQAHGGHDSLLNSLYHSGQLFILHMPHLDDPISWPLECARWLAAGVFAVTTLSALYQIFATEMRRFWFGFSHGHVVICGLGRKGLDLVRCHRGKTRRENVVVIERQASPELIQGCHAAGATIIVGDATDPAVLRNARVHHAKQLIAVCGEDQTNVEIAVRAQQLVASANPRGSAKQQCFVHLTDIDLRSSVQRNRLLTGTRDRWEVRFFDILERNARRLLSEVLPLDHTGIRADDPRQVHLALLGFGRMGRSVALKAAQLGHFLNRKPLKISVIDRYATKHEENMLFRYPAFREVCELECHRIEIESTQSRALLNKWCEDRGTAFSVAACFDDDSLALDVALRLLPKLHECGRPIAVRMATRTGLAALLKEDLSPKEVSYYVRTFGTFDEDCCERAYNDQEQDAMAKFIQLRFIAKGAQQGRKPDVDAAMRGWDELPEDYKDSCRQQADHLPIKLRGIGCEIVPEHDQRPEATITDAEVELLAEIEHVRWIAERRLAGWRYAPGKKNEELKTNPNMVPWSDPRLEESIKDYDRDTIRNIAYVLKTLKKKACRQQPIP